MIQVDTLVDSVLLYGQVSHNYRALRCKMGHPTDVPVLNQEPSGVSPSLRSIVRYGASQSVTVSRDMGPLSVSAAFPVLVVVFFFPLLLLYLPYISLSALDPPAGPEILQLL